MHTNPLKLLTFSSGSSVTVFNSLNLKIKKNLLFLYFFVEACFVISSSGFILLHHS